MQTKQVVYLGLALIVIGGVALGGCTKKSAESITESIIEQSTNDDVDVDIGTNTVTINTNGGSFQAGDNVSLPENFPTDIYVIDGDLKSSISTSDTGSFSITLQSDESFDDTKTAYQRELADAGWTVTGTYTYGTSMTLAAEKDDRDVTVSITEADGIVTVSITTTQDQ